MLLGESRLRIGLIERHGINWGLELPTNLVFPNHGMGRLTGANLRSSSLVGKAYEALGQRFACNLLASNPTRTGLTRRSMGRIPLRPSLHLAVRRCASS